MITIASFFTNNGTPQEGLTPVITILEVATGNVVVPGESGDVMTELSGGWYKYDFNGDETKDYTITCDGGASLTTADRYTFAGTEIKSNLSDIEALIIRILGLSQENYRTFDEQYQTIKGNSYLTGAKIRIYPSAADVNADTNYISSYTVAATYDSQGRMTDYKVTKD